MENRLFKKTILKINFILFNFYYSKVDTHFHQWTFFKSVDLLRQNYEHDKILIENANQGFKNALHELDACRKELSNIRMQQIAKPGQINTVNKMFGTDFTDSKNN